MRRKNVMVGGVTLLLLLAGFAIVVPHPTSGVDVGREPLTTAPNPDPNTPIQAAIWDGDEGVCVGEKGVVYSMTYDFRQGVTYKNVSTVSTDFYGVDRGYKDAYFLVVGHGSLVTDPTVYYVNSTIFTSIGTPTDLAAETLYDVAVDPVNSSRFIVVGSDGTNGVIYYYDGTGFHSVNNTGIGIPPSGDILQGVTAVYDGAEWYFLIVGSNSAGDGVVYYINESALASGTYDGALQAAPTLPADAYACEAIPPTMNYAMVTGKGYAYVLRPNGTVAFDFSEIFPSLKNGNNIALYDVNFYTPTESTTEGFVVGVNTSSNDGAIFMYTKKDSSYGVLSEYTLGSISLTNTSLSAVAPKDFGSPRFVTIFGSDVGTGTPIALSANSVSATNQLNVNTLYPHIDKIEMFEGTPGSLGASVLNSYIDVDTGTGSTVYTIKITAHHDDGWDNATKYIHLYLWWDDGKNESNSVYPGGVNNNTEAYFQFENVPSGSDTWTAPNDWGQHEIELLTGSCRDVAINDTTHEVYFVLIFNKQVWATTGTFTEAAGSTATDQHNVTLALNDKNTWDIKAEIVDTNNAGKDTAYDEFGIYKYTELTADGLPGDQSGSGPPGASITLLPAGQDVIFSANYNYSLSVWAEDLWNPSKTAHIGASNLSVEGGQWAPGNAQHLPGAGETNRVYLLGGSGSWTSPNEGGNTTTTSNAVGGGTAVTWYCDIPIGVPEDHFYGTINYVLEHA